MTLFFTFLLALHGAVHLMGAAKAFVPGSVPQLKTPIGTGTGVLWLVACLGFWAAAAALHAAPRAFWMLALPAVVLSQVLIVRDWSDARFGTIPNALALIPIAVALLDLRPSSFASAYRREAERHLSHSVSSAVVTEADLAPLPPLVQGYLRRTGVVGQPRVRNFRARFHGEMRNGKEAGWMSIRAEQSSSLEDSSRAFLMQATLKGLPFEALHVYADGAASMRVRIASLFDVVDARGPLMNQSETVTLFNDMCLLAPGSLLDPRIHFAEAGERTVRGTFENHGVVVHADLTFDESGDLAGFLSSDRYQSADGKTFQKYPWWTPIKEYRKFGAARIGAVAEAVWKEPGGDFTYARFVVDELSYNAPAARDDERDGALALRGGRRAEVDRR